MSRQRRRSNQILPLFAIIMLAGCGSYTPPSTLSTVIVEVTREVTASPVLATVEVTREIEATRVVEVIKRVLVTPTPAPLLADDCHQKAMTTVEMNACYVLEYDLSLAELDKVVTQIKSKMVPEEQLLFDDLQKGWLAQTERDCEFFFGQVEQLEDGTLIYEWGSMAPLQRASCLAGKTKDRTLELREVYLCSNFRCGDN